MKGTSDLDPQGHMPAWVKQKQRKGNQGEAKAKPKLGLEKCPVDRYLMRIHALILTSAKQKVSLFYPSLISVGDIFLPLIANGVLDSGELKYQPPSCLHSP